MTREQKQIRHLKIQNRCLALLSFGLIGFAALSIYLITGGPITTALIDIALVLLTLWVLFALYVGGFAIVKAYEINYQ